MKPREHKTRIDYEVVFDDGRGNGFGFPCDEEGHLLGGLHPQAIINYQDCMAHPEKFVRWNKIVEYPTSYTEPASGVCVCGQTVELWDSYLGACECPGCGRWYNLFGQELNHPRMWREADDW